MSSYGVAPPGFRAPNATRLGMVRLQVGDLETSLGWYQRVLGLAPVDGRGDRTMLAPAGGGEPIIELRAAPAAGEGRTAAAARPDAAAPARPAAADAAGGAAGPAARAARAHEAPRLGLFHYAILLPSRADLARFVRRLHELRVPFGASDHLVSEAVYLQDPDGLGIEVYADRPRETWAASPDGQLEMATLPLNTGDLLTELGGSTWRGMPDGTTIGHVHLHVGDLRQADAFYHTGLGLDRVVWSYRGALFLSAGGYHHHLGLNTWAGPAAVRPGADEPQLVEWELVLPSSEHVAGAVRGLADAGFSAAADAGGATVQDPWGTRLRLRPG